MAEGARSLLTMGHQPKRLLADRAYDARSLRQMLAEQRIKAVIPPNPTRKHPHCYDKAAYKGRNVIERMFAASTPTTCAGPSPPRVHSPSSPTIRHARSNTRSTSISRASMWHRFSERQRNREFRLIGHCLAAIQRNELLRRGDSQRCKF